MKTNFLIALILGVFVTYIGSSVSLADYVIDDFQTADVTAPFVTVDAVTDNTGRIIVDRVASSGEGYKITYGAATGQAGDTTTASIEYSFTNGLRSLFPGSYTGKGWAPVKFHIPIFIGNLSEGTFSVNVRQFFTDSNDNFDTAISPDATSNSMLEIDTGKTIGDLDTSDLTSVKFDITYSVGTFTGFADQTLFLGGGIGVRPNGRVGSFTAIPEPTSAAMIGCALVGLIARRRRKA